VGDIRSRLVQCELSVKQLLAAKPSCSELRPACGAASTPVGKRMVVVGHGVRERQVLGPLAFGGKAEFTLIAVRRYRCRACRSVCTVVPWGVLHGRWYGAVAIALALGLMVREGRSTPAIHEEVSPFKGAGVSARLRADGHRADAHRGRRTEGHHRGGSRDHR
jgi:hypothetical protein